MVLLSSSDKIEVCLSGAITTNQLQCFCKYEDRSTLVASLTDTENRNLVVTNNTSDVSLVVGSSDTNIQRVVSFISIYNSDTVDQTVIIKYDTGSLNYILFKKLLTPGLYYLTMTNNSTANITIRTHASNGIPNVFGYPSTLGSAPLATAIRSTKTYAVMSNTADLTSAVFSTDSPIISVRVASYP